MHEYCSLSLAYLKTYNQYFSLIWEHIAVKNIKHDSY